MNIINLAALQKALSHLETHYSLTVKEIDLDKKFAFETATIKSFEYTYELTLKIIKRILENSFEVREIDTLNFKSFIRTAAERALISSPEFWFSYRESRNITAHTYDEIKADQIFSVIPNFIKEVKFVINKVEKHNVS